MPKKLAKFQKILKIIGHKKLRLGIAILTITALAILAKPIQSLLPVRYAPGQASFYFGSIEPDLRVDSTFSVDLRINSKTPINAVGTVIQYNPKQLEVLNMTTVNSFCSFYLENSFDTIKGEVHIACGTPSPGFKGDSIIVQIMVRPITPGITELTLREADTMILANDGKGSNLINNIPSQSLNIKHTF